jgi:DNA-binding GntR family transcriptional regulator
MPSRQQLNDPRKDTKRMTRRSIAPLEKPPPLRQQVYEALESLIIYGGLSSGQHLVESDLAKRLGVSRIPVREALQLLHRDGWVDLRPRQGAFVHQPTVREVDEVFSVRTILEVESTKLAAQNANDGSLNRLKDLVVAGSDALRVADERELVKLNSLFHGEITDIAGNQVLGEILHRLDARIRWYFAQVVMARGADSWREHAAIVDALAAGDAKRAADAMREHAESTRAAYHRAREAE